MIFVTNNSVFGKNLKSIRESNGFSTFHMAKLLNLPEETLNDIESGKHMEISGLTLRILLNLLEDETQDLFENHIPTDEHCGI